MELPPVIQIANDAELWEVTSAQELFQKLNSEGLEEELRTQANWTIGNFVYVDAPRKGESNQAPARADFAVTPSATLNPFATSGKCAAEKCSAATTDNFIKTVGLYADTAIIPDPLTATFFNQSSNPHIDYSDLFRDLKILQKILPLIESGVIELAAPVHKFCQECSKRIENVLDEATESLIVPELAYEAELIKAKDNSAFLASRLPLFEPDHLHPLTTISPLSKEEAAILARIGKRAKAKTKASNQLIRRIIARNLQRELSEILFELDTARRTGSLLLAGSRAETLAIGSLDRAGPGVTEVEDWENLRAVNLPWINSLSAEEILILRNEASHALPRLRELLRSRLVAGTQTSEPLKDTVAELRSQALEVQSELAALGLPKERTFRLGMAGLAMSFVVYGFASQSPPLVATSIAGLLATLGHLRNTEREHESKVSNLVSTPAYAPKSQAYNRRAVTLLSLQFLFSSINESENKCNGYLRVRAEQSCWG